MYIPLSHRSMRSVVYAIFLFAAVAVLMPAAAAAQAENQQSQRLMVTVVTVKPDMVDEYEAFVKSETIPALQKGGVAWRDGWKTAMFGNSFEYTYVQPISSYADFDGPSVIEKALGKDGAEAWARKANKFSTSVKRYVVQTRPDLSYNPGMSGPPSVAVVSHATAAQGRNAEVETWVKNDLLPAMRQAKVPGYLVSQVTLGGNANEYITLVLHANMAELEKGPPVYRVMSKEAGDKLYAKLAAGALTNVERYVVRYVPELSIARPAATAGTKKN